MRTVAAIVLFIALTVSASSGGHVATLAGPEEAGQRLIVSGQVFDPSGTKPAPGVTVYAYHTDASGVYNKPLRPQPRLRGWVVTDASGRFELRTIRPGSYPGRTDPAHIHFQLSGGGYPKQSHALEFADDPKVTESHLSASKAKGRFAPIVTTKKDKNGVLHATINIRVSNKPN